MALPGSVEIETLFAGGSFGPPAPTSSRNYASEMRAHRQATWVAGGR